MKKKDTAIPAAQNVPAEPLAEHNRRVVVLKRFEWSASNARQSITLLPSDGDEISVPANVAQAAVDAGHATFAVDAD